MTPFQQAVKFNNEAVTALLEGNYSTAVESLTNSIKAMKQQLSNAAKPTQTDKTDSLSFSSRNLSIVELPVPEDQQDSFLFNNVFVIPDTDNDELPAADINMYTAAVVFNMALAHHRQRNQPLKKTEKLYQMTLKVLGHQSYHPNSCSCYMSLVIQLASINNLSQLHSNTHGMEDMAMEVVQKLCNVVSLVGTVDNDNHGMFFDDRYLQELLVNVLFLKAPEVAAAA